jgi:hypothetical protein
MKKHPFIGFTGLMGASAFFILSASSIALADLTQTQIQSARLAAAQIIEPQVQTLEVVFQAKHPGWKVSTFDIRKANTQPEYQVIEIPLIAKVKHLGNLTRVAVRTGVGAYSPDGKVEGVRKSYRILVDLTPDGQVIRAESNSFDNIMSNDPPTPYNLFPQGRPDSAR